MDGLNTGNIINYWGPHLTPYARAIISAYRIAVPVWVTVPTNLTGTVREEIQVLTDPFEYDTLFIAAHIQMGTLSNGDNGQLIFLNVGDLQTGMLWSTPGPIDASPATSFGGSRANAMPVLKLPEAFFLPANVQLKHLWKVFSTSATGGVITWMAIQLIDPLSGNRPHSVQMPDGRDIRVGSRVPWLSTFALGSEINILGSPNYAMAADDAQYVQYLPSQDCDIEIHDIACNFFTQGGVASDSENIRLALADRKQPRFWTPTNAPSTVVCGDFSKAYPAMPLVKPYTLKKGHRLEVISQNKNALVLNNAYATVRGVKLCDY